MLKPPRKATGVNLISYYALPKLRVTVGISLHAGEQTRYNLPSEDTIPAPPIWWSYKMCATRAAFTGATLVLTWRKAGWPWPGCPLDGMTAICPGMGLHFQVHWLEQARLCHLSSSTTTAQPLENCPSLHQLPQLSFPSTQALQVHNRGQDSSESPGIQMLEKTEKGINSRNLLNT